MCRTAVDEWSKGESRLTCASGASTALVASMAARQPRRAVPARTYRSHPSSIPPISFFYKNDSEVMARLERPRLATPYPPPGHPPPQLLLSSFNPISISVSVLARAFSPSRTHKPQDNNYTAQYSQKYLWNPLRPLDLLAMM